MTNEEAPDAVESPGFFRRNRVTRRVIGVVITAVLVVAYLFGVLSYRAGLGQSLPEQSPPTGGVAVVIVPQRVSPEDQTLPAQVLLFPDPDLLDSSGLLKHGIEVRIEPALSGQDLTFPAGRAPTPQKVLLPATGLVQEYPFDSYNVSALVQANTIPADVAGPVTAITSIYFRVPGWSGQDAASPAGAAASQVVSTRLGRDASTKSIALLLLSLMVILAAIAVLVTGAATRGRMKLELSVASWMTGLMFALLPIRQFFPDGPPLGSWMDILVFFWVELILMLSVGAVAATILLRARDTSHHPKDTP